MQTESTFLDDLKYQFKHGSMTIRLLFINVIVFLSVRIIDVFVDLSSGVSGTFISSVAHPIFSLHTDFWEFLKHPWGLFTSIFAHYDFFHLAFNMIFLYFAGKLFEQLFDQRRLLYTYILGGVFGGLLEVIAHGVFPKLQMTGEFVVGASGSIMAIFVAIAFYRPNLKVNLFGILPVRIIILAVFFILSDILGLSNIDGTAHFAHLGGAIFGMISIQNPHSSHNILVRTEGFVLWFKRLLSSSRSPKMKVKQGGGAARGKSDEEYAAEKKMRQAQTDKILDKISKSGYESLTKKEKEFLFNQSNNG